MTREIFIQLVHKELYSLRRFLLAACRGDSNEADDVAFGISVFRGCK